MNYVEAVSHIYPQAKHNVDFIVITTNDITTVTMLNHDLQLPSQAEMKEASAQVEAIHEEQELLDSLIPSRDEIAKAETEILIINILMEVGLI
ncbi:hypothetical protein [Desulfosporosinus meridiei]|uniref:Uncharacterized protein n=1 Tax=Desulfosporosinus meridiei (strain ATCC BAA-275 / DSM 13257 / KCTC 12902 / NCIMB 13706 / S10) TaxID=768704 RepID=J7J5N9_DESMD|nr:hypothetical protein [Desulfosporosinus meridiei]AFQ46256.1 hypothetical protein Desmer_4450 [Desulfosporosinus meridiei DSM 13257]